MLSAPGGSDASTAGDPLGVSPGTPTETAHCDEDVVATPGWSWLAVQAAPTSRKAPINGRAGFSLKLVIDASNAGLTSHRAFSRKRRSAEVVPARSGQGEAQAVIGERRS